VKAPTPDPRPAILQLDADCRALGIHLMVVPAPDKAMIQAAQLTARMKAGAGAMPNNQGYSSFAASMRAQGVDVLDVWPDRFNPAANSYLVQDTHWTPEFMEETARTLAMRIGRSGDLPPRRCPIGN
jgi:hypothetical protein